MSIFFDFSLRTNVSCTFGRDVQRAQRLGVR